MKIACLINGTKTVTATKRAFHYSKTSRTCISYLKGMILMGIRKKKNFNCPAVCDCSSTFDIRQNATISFPLLSPNIEANGGVTLRGEICPDCNNSRSEFEISFEDTDLSDGDLSFNFKFLAINPPTCLETPNGFLQNTTAIGIYKNNNGDCLAANIQFVFEERIGLGVEDFVHFNIRSLENNTIVSAIINIADEDLTLTECNDQSN